MNQTTAHMHLQDQNAPSVGGEPVLDGTELDRIAPGSTAAVFREAARQGTVSAWWGHVPFAHWLMRVARPRSVVELGTHNGVSYAAFCSSVLAEGFDCRCIAVDTWLGDHQAGEYDEEVYRDLTAWHAPRYAAFSTLMRCTFDEALSAVEDGSVDVLHIDGLHTYEAVRHDFETWLPKLSRCGVVLFHDTEERAGDFGVWRLWAELQERYPSFSFPHSHGLGLIVVGDDAPEAVRALCAADPALAARIQALFALIGRRWAAEGELLFEVRRVARMREEAADLRIELRQALEDFDRERVTAAVALEEAAALRLEARQARAEAAAAEARADAVLNSTTWRAAEPLRAALARMPALQQIARLLILPAIRAARASLRALRWLRGGAHLRVARSGLFDASHYLAANPDVAAARIDPLDHYLSNGWREGRDPSPSFSTRGYLLRYEDVRSQGANPLVHYVQCGERERRAIVTPAGTIAYRQPVRSRAGKIIDLLGVIARRPSLALTLARGCRQSDLRHAAAVLWQATAAPEELPVPVPSTALDEDAWLTQTFRIVPYYLNPHLRQDPPIPALRLAVHLHLYYEEMAERCIGYLRNIPTRFDLFVSIPEGRDAAVLARRLAEALPEAGQVQVEAVPNRGRDIAPLIVQFGKRLSGYDAIAHFHTKQSPHKASLADWFDTLMGTLCGSRSGVAQILDLLARDAKTVYPAGNKTPVGDTGWSDNLPIARRVLESHGFGRAEEFPYVEFPQGTMFWARAGSLKQLLALNLGFDDFPKEPITPDATLAHALERLILVLAQPEPGRNYRLETPELSREQSAYFEAQHDFSNEIRHDTVKVLAYYLPQFHPTPENSAWHGEGFTEWHKVRGAQPLFHGHYQQHVPHPDIGYYHLESPPQLQKQADLMRRAGVHGMIFYHYWFSGRLILEKPAQMLLAHPEIQMPFCFCWANENWTRRWDGNEQEILLGQVYSAEDAAAFIRYLIPFFRDERYIKIEGRPVLYVYRPASIEGVREYVDIWKRESEAAGILAPYLVAVLTRGATSPLDHGMDAGAERVLHDWLGAAARDIRGELRPYWPVNGSVLNYRDVASHYTAKALTRDYPLFRSLVPAWDNTARYGSEAFIIHGFTTESMQGWIEHLVADAERHLPPDRRFVIINAWNEWAEGAHLEPDMRFGYGYLNAVGRALSGRRFGALDYIRVEAGVTLALELDPLAAERLRVDLDAGRKFAHSLAASAMLARCRLVVPDEHLAHELRIRGLAPETGGAEQAAFTLRFSDLFLFPDTTVERMLQMGLRYPGQAIVASPLNDPAFLHDPAAANWQIPYSARTGMELRPREEPRGYKICPDAHCFRMGAQSGKDASDFDRVSTVIRFHDGGDLRLLTRALLSLLAQGGCRVRAYIGVQDLRGPARADLQAALDALPWPEDAPPVVRFFDSDPSRPDLRSAMLNEMLRAAGSGYVAFLDYDDILFPNAYKTLLGRLKKTGKNATFARVYSTTVDVAHGIVLQRDKVYCYGRTYDDFFQNNHAPLHSFMLDTKKINVDSIEYFDDMKFIEDYYMLLQIFTRQATDWDSLAEDIYIADYIHMLSSDANTLAITDPEKRREQLLSPEYRLSVVRVSRLKKRIVERGLRPQPAAAD